MVRVRVSVRVRNEDRPVLSLGKDIVPRVCRVKRCIQNVTVIASRQRCVNMVFRANDKVLIKSLYHRATELVQTFD